jgi:hypothetical protein
MLLLSLQVAAFLWLNRLWELAVIETGDRSSAIVERYSSATFASVMLVSWTVTALVNVVATRTPHPSARLIGALGWASVAGVGIWWYPTGLWIGGALGVSLLLLASATAPSATTATCSDQCASRVVLAITSSLALLVALQGCSFVVRMVRAAPR